MKKQKQVKTKYTASEISKLNQAIEQKYPDGHWLTILKLCSYTGVATVRQLMTATNLSRDKIRSRLQFFEELVGSEEILARVPFDVPRPGVRGRPSAVYQLGQIGAALLRANGHPKARPSALKDVSTVAHARAVLDIRLAAEVAGLDVKTERELPYTDHNGEQKVIRPDLQVMLAGGRWILIEIEQVADLSLLRRIVDSLRRRALFFQSIEASDIFPTVRTLINLPFSRAWDKTTGVWERAMAIVAEEIGGSLPFEIVAMPLQRFLDAPDWSEPSDGQRWESLFDPAQVSTFDPLSDQEENQSLVPTKKGKRSKLAVRQEQLPEELKRRSARDDYLIMCAFWQHLREHGPSLMHTYDRPQPDPVFFDMVRIIYAASHPVDATPWEQALHPHASLYLFQQYLQMHPILCQALSKSITRGSGSMRWSTPVITQRIQTVVDTFLRYHGFSSAGSLWASPIGPWRRRDERGDFDIQVQLTPEVLMGEGDGIVPSHEEVKQTEDALAWVLRALFAYGEDLKLKQATFW